MRVLTTCARSATHTLICHCHLHQLRAELNGTLFFAAASDAPSYLPKPTEYSNSKCRHGNPSVLLGYNTVWRHLEVHLSLSYPRAHKTRMSSLRNFEVFPPFIHVRTRHLYEGWDRNSINIGRRTTLAREEFEMTFHLLFSLLLPFALA